MVIDAFVNKKIPLADGSYSQYYERKSGEEPNLFWLEHLDKCENSSEEIKKSLIMGLILTLVKRKDKKPKILV